MPLVSFEGGRMAFDPFSWAIGFTLTRTAGCLFKKICATRDGFLLRSRLPIIYNQLAARWPIAAV
jgi:hypothetical protein